MKLKTIAIVASLIVFISCGTKPGKTVGLTIKDIEKQVTAINADKTLKQDLTEGALTDTKGFKDIGSFKYRI